VIVKISRHVFGSDQGYRTLGASDDLTSEEVADLESFAFGQTDNLDYLATLKSTPAYWSRQLSSGRRAITRVLAGPADDKGRQSLLFITVVVHTNDWLRSLNGEDAPLLGVHQVWSWKGEQRLPREEIRVSKPARVRPSPDQQQRILSLLGLIESLSDSENSSIVLEERDLTTDELAMVCALLPVWYRPRFSYAVRSLSESLPVQLNYLAPPASRGKSRRKIVRWTPSRGLVGAKYASGLSHFWTPGESPPWQFVENCKAFGKLLPTWEGVDNTAGTATPAIPVRPARAPRRSKLRIPPYLYWVVLVLMVLSATGFVVNRTVRTRRHAEATLTAAAEFLGAHADPALLPSSGSARQELIAQAELHASQVASLQDSSRADRQQAIGDQFKEWLAHAGVRAEEYGTLDELLAGFETFCEPLGLSRPGDVDRVPDDKVRAGVHGWNRRLAESAARAAEIGGPYPERIATALARIMQWQNNLQSLIQKCAESLAVLEQALQQRPPGQLTKKALAEWESYRAEMERIKQVLPPESVPTGQSEPVNIDTIGAAIVELRASLNRVEDLSAVWDQWATEMKAAFEKLATRGNKLFEAKSLYFEPTRPTDLDDPWKAATDCLDLFDKALDKWPDEEDVLAKRIAVRAWMGKASSLAMDYFQGEVDHAQQIWDTETSQPSGVGTNGVGNALPNPAPAINVLQRAMEYWLKNVDVIRGFDREMADRVHVRAASLMGELMSASDRYKKVIGGTPSPSPGAGTP